MSKKDKKQIILDTALTLFVNNGFHATSTASIAKTAGVATGTLFHHFPSKDELMKHLFLSIKQEFADALQQGVSLSGEAEKDSRQLWHYAIQWAMDNPVKQYFFQQYATSPAIPQKIRQLAWDDILSFLADLIKEGQTKGIFKPYPLPLMLENCHGQFISTTSYFIENPQHWQDERYRQASFDMYWSSMKA